jgi:hypothetical protein
VKYDRTIPNFKPGTINRDNERGTCVLINIAISGDRNMIKTRTKDFKIQISYGRKGTYVQSKKKVIPIGAVCLWRS